MREENLDIQDCIRTSSGIYINIFEPTLDMICIEDIAHALSNQCRFGGHLPKFYSVLQHCIECMKRAPRHLKLEALMHDASEAYLLDIPTPIKGRLSNYKEIENDLMKTISNKFNFSWPMDSTIKKIDREVLEFEWEHFMLEIPTDEPFHIMTSEEAKEAFLFFFHELVDLKTISV